MRRVYSDPLYDIYLCVYSGLMDSKSHGDDLVTCMIVFRNEGLRLMFKLWTAEIRGDRDAYLEQAVDRLLKEGRGPFHLVRDAKTWCKVPFSPKDKAALTRVGLSLDG